MHSRAAVCSLALCGCTPVAPVAPSIVAPSIVDATSASAPRHDEVLEGLVVLEPGSELFDAPAGQLRARVLGSGVVPDGTMRALGRHGDWVEVATARFPGPLCRRAWLPLADFELRFWVRDEDLMPVVSRRTRVEFDDGSAMTLEPGTPLELVDGQASGVWIARERFAAAIPASAVATIFPQRPPVLAMARPIAMVPSDVETSLDGEPLPVALVDRLRPSWIQGPQSPRGAAPQEQLVIYDWRPETRIAELRMELQPNCASFEVRLADVAEPAALPESMQSAWPTGNLDGWAVITVDLPPSPWLNGGRGSVKLPEDVTIYWAEGGVAGRTILPTTIPSRGRTLEGRRCFDIWLGHATLLCVDEVDVVESGSAD